MTRITGQLVQRISQYAAEISDGLSGPCRLGASLGYGARIVDGNRQLVWVGRPRLAAAYYLGQVYAYAERKGIVQGDMPDYVTDTYYAVLTGAAGPVREEFANGQNDARARLDYPARIK